MPPKQKMTPQQIEQILEKTGAKKLEGTNKVSFYKGDQEFQIAQNPKVYFNEATSTYYFIGDPRLADYAEQTNQLLRLLNNAAKNKKAGEHPANCECEEHKKEEKEEQATTYTKDDVTTVMEQGQVSEERAKELLDQHKDVINAVIACQNEKK